MRGVPSSIKGVTINTNSQLKIKPVTQGLEVGTRLDIQHRNVCRIPCRI